jgi:hypothetical protein
MYIIFRSEDLKARDHAEDFGVDRRIILEWILGKQGGEVWTGCIKLRIYTSGGSCEHGNETSGSIKCGEFLDEVNDY